MIRPAPLAVGLLVLAGVWAGPLPGLAGQLFAAHMAMHMAVVALAAPLLALAVVGRPLDPVPHAPALFAALPASLVELAIVWGWHAPALHHAARAHPGALVLEQGSFLTAGLLLWLAAFGGSRALRRQRAGAGVAGLLLTSMHMTLLGALLALAPRPLYRHGAAGAGALPPLEDQQLGGAIMLLVGAAAYLAGGVALTALALRDEAAGDGVAAPARSRAGLHGD